MAIRITIRSRESAVSGGIAPVEYLDALQMERLMEAFHAWHESAPSGYLRRVRGRYWLAFLFLRFTGARIGEILRLDDLEDIDYQSSEIRIPAAAGEAIRQIPRRVPVPREVVARVLAYLEEFPHMRGRVFALDQGNFRREFYRRAEEAEIPRKLSHPHILRHSRAIEMLQAGVPLTTVRDLLGHSLSSTTAIYLQRIEVEETAEIILREKGLI